VNRDADFSEEEQTHKHRKAVSEKEKGRERRKEDKASDSRRIEGRSEVLLRQRCLW